MPRPAVPIQVWLQTKSSTYQALGNSSASWFASLPMRAAICCRSGSLSYG
jgi:hypothetical protein